MTHTCIVTTVIITLSR